MKKMILIAFIIAIFSVNANATNGTEVSNIISQSFNNDFSNAKNVQWNLNEDFAKASFTLNGENVEAFYDYNGEMVGSSKNISIDKLPAKALRSFTKKYPFPTYQLKESIEFVNANEETNYFISLDDLFSDSRVILRISPDGNVALFKKLSITKK
ncbi:MAG: hypothetical protein LC122_09885 [Chitinophagales bacterium]|nr:hypothetical protein [Chitinophagales bacterium]